METSGPATRQAVGPDTAITETVAVDTATESLNAVTGLSARERVRAFDLAAGLAVFFMILVHILWHWGARDTWTTPIGVAISLAAGPTAAPVFMFLMGASLGAAPDRRFGSLAARGLWLLVLGYVLNLLRGVIPASIGLATGVITADEVAPYTPWWLGTTVDLHHAIGISMIVIAALSVRTRPGLIWLCIGGALVVFAPWLRTIAFGTPLLDAPLTPILGSATNVYYAVVPWLVFPLAGAVFGSLVARVPDRTALFRRGALVGLGFLLVGGVLVAIVQPGFDVFTYWRMPLALCVPIFGIILVWLFLCDLATRVRFVDLRLGIVYGWSDRVIAMYFTHWVIVGWGVGLVGFRALGLPQVLVAMAAAVVATSYLSRFAVRLESSWWVRRGSAPRRASELGVELPVEAPAA
jgi:uncharacterized membrane protein